MNLEHAKQIPISRILEIMGFSPVKVNEDKLLVYVSPFNEKSTPTLYVSTVTNEWFDRVAEKGGNGLALVSEYLKLQGEDHTQADTLRWLKIMTVKPMVPEPSFSINNEKNDHWHLKKVKPLSTPALINYLSERGIPYELAQKHVKEVYVRHLLKPLATWAIGFQNEDGGYELRNPHFNGVVNPKNITFVRAEAQDPEGINVFEHFMDFLTVAKVFPEIVIRNDNIILNSVTFIKRAFPYINGYGYKVLYDWTDIDSDGKIASRKIKRFVKSQEGQRHKGMQSIFSPCKDVAKWHIKNLNKNV